MASGLHSSSPPAAYPPAKGLPPFLPLLACLPSCMPTFVRRPHKSYRQCWSCPPKCSSWPKQPQLDESLLRAAAAAPLTTSSSHVADPLTVAVSHRRKLAQIPSNSSSFLFFLPRLFPRFLPFLCDSDVDSGNGSLEAAEVAYLSKRPRPPDGGGRRLIII